MNIARYKKTVSSILWVQLALVTCYVPSFSIIVPPANRIGYTLIIPCSTKIRLFVSRETSYNTVLEVLCSGSITIFYRQTMHRPIAAYYY